MKGIDVSIVRLLPILCFVCIGINLYDGWNGEFTLFSKHFHSNSAIYASSLFLISLANKRYHCVWNRAMYIELILFPTTNYLDAKYGLFPDVILYLRIITYTYALSLIATILLAVRHFIIKRKNRYQEFKIKRNGDI